MCTLVPDCCGPTRGEETGHDILGMSIAAERHRLPEDRAVDNVGEKIVSAARSSIERCYRKGRLEEVLGGGHRCLVDYPLEVARRHSITRGRGFGIRSVAGLAGQLDVWQGELDRDAGEGTLDDRRLAGS